MSDQAIQLLGKIVIILNDIRSYLKQSSTKPIETPSEIKTDEPPETREPEVKGFDHYEHTFTDLLLKIDPSGERHRELIREFTSFGITDEDTGEKKTIYCNSIDQLRRSYEKSGKLKWIQGACRNAEKRLEER